MFSIAINCVENFISLKDGQKKVEDLDVDIQNYKKEIGKYHKIIMSDSWTNENIVINGAIIEEHKKKFKAALDSNNKQDIIEVLLSLRVNALQTNPDLRTNFVDDLIKYDILNITETKSNDTVINILNNQEYNIRNAMMSVLSIIVSKSEGIEYIVSQGEQIIKKVIQIMKGTEDGQVLQRFAIAILQKMSVKLFESDDMNKNEEIKKINNMIISIYNKHNIIDWLIKLFQRNKTNKVHEFCMNYGSALLANILGYKETIDCLFDNLSFYKNITESLLDLIKDKGNKNTQVLMHYLMCLNYLSIDKFKMIKEEINFEQQIKTFEEEYQKDNENNNVNKKTVLNLSFLLFHSEKGKELKKNINENIKRKGEPLIFECFRDEIC
jgi:hypothetical protein